MGIITDFLIDKAKDAAVSKSKDITVDKVKDAAIDKAKDMVIEKAEDIYMGEEDKAFKNRKPRSHFKKPWCKVKMTLKTKMSLNKNVEQIKTAA